MQKKTDWLPTRLADLLVMFTNIVAKISIYQPVLPLTIAQSIAITAIAQQFIDCYNYVEQAKTTNQSLVEWRNIIFNGDPKGDAAQDPPTPGTPPDVTTWTIGIIDQFRDWVELIKASPGYTRAIGEDLMIVSVKGDELVEADVTPSLKVTASPGYEVDIAGSLQGMDALKVEYSRKGGTGFVLVGFLTKLPGSVLIAPHTPGEPETGNIRGHFIKKNVPFGNSSPEYPVTLS